MPMEDRLNAEVLRQASAVVGRPVVLWEVIGSHQAVARASSGTDVGAQPPGFDLDAILRRWNVPIAVGSLWVTAPGPTPDAWVVAPVRARSQRGGRFDAVRVVRSCLTLERRLLRDRGIELEFTTSLDTLYMKGDANALFDLLVSLVRTAADPSAGQPKPVRVQLEQKGKEPELTVSGGRSRANVAKVRTAQEDIFSGTEKVHPPASAEEGDTTLTIALPLPPQRDADRRP